MNFAARHTHRHDPQTSYDAAAVAETKIGRHKVLIRSALVGLHGFGTSEQIAERTSIVGIDYHEVARRLPDMERDGIVRKSDQTATNSKGNRCTVWQLI